MTHNFLSCCKFISFMENFIISQTDVSYVKLLFNSVLKFSIEEIMKLLVLQLVRETT